MTKSALVTKEILSKNYGNYKNGVLINPERTAPITKLTPHHAGVVATAEAIANGFAKPERKASANYIIGNDGEIILCVPEEYRAWTSGNADNDNAAITVEICNSSGEPEWRVSDAALESLIKLGVDICRRHGLPGFTWTGDKNGTLTIHKMFQATACPGPYLESKMPYIAGEITRRLKDHNGAEDMLYRVQVGAFSVKAKAEKFLEELKTDGYEGFIVPVEAECHIFENVDEPMPAPTPTVNVGSVVRVAEGAKSYDGVTLASFVYKRNHMVSELTGDRAVITYDGQVVAAVYVSDLSVV